MFKPVILIGALLLSNVAAQASCIKWHHDWRDFFYFHSARCHSAFPYDRCRR